MGYAGKGEKHSANGIKQLFPLVEEIVANAPTIVGCVFDLYGENVVETNKRNPIVFIDVR